MADVLRDDKVDAILCVAGGWAGGSAASSGEERLPSLRSLLLPSVTIYPLYAYGLMKMSLRTAIWFGSKVCGPL